MARKSKKTDAREHQHRPDKPGKVDKKKKKKENKMGYANNIDLEILPAIFVSTGMNRNDDVFLPEETWAARHTVTHKPVNLFHDNEEIVGHIFDAYIIDQEKGETHAIADDDEEDEIPHSFDIVTKSYLYRMQLKDKLDDIIEDAKAGNKFVSMEVFFSDYDYLVEDKIVARNEETSFLDQSLRSKGGSGEFEGRRVGRILKNMVFGGMGIVDNPANPRSVILLGPNENPTNQGLAKMEEKPIENIRENCVLVDDEIAVANSEKEENRMENKTKELEAQLAEAHKEIDELKQGETQNTISELKDENEALKTKVEELHTSLTARDAALIAASEEAVEAIAKLEQAGVQQEKLVAKNAELEEQNITTRLAIRSQKLGAFELSEDDITFVLAEIREMNDEDFESYLTRAERMWKKKVEVQEEKAEAAVVKPEIEVADKADLAHAALEDATSNPEDMVFNSEDGGVMQEVALAVESIWAKEG
jgi:hypothetical protein